MRKSQRGWIIDPYRYGGGAALSGKLDSYQTSVWAEYSVIYLLKIAYAGGPLFRVRRSSDNAEQDIGHDGAGLVDSAALLTFTGAGSGYVVTLYDQSGNARDITQATTGNQPRIVNAGTFDKGAIFDGSSSYMQTPSVSSGSARTILCTHVLKNTPITGTGVILESNPLFTSDGLIWAVSDDVDGPPNHDDGVRWLSGDGTHNADLIAISYTYNFNSHGAKASVATIFDRSQSVNASQIVVVTESDAPVTLTAGPNITSPIPSNSFGAHALNLGARNNSGLSLYCAMQLQNLVIYTAAKSTSDMAAACALLPLYT